MIDVSFGGIYTVGDNGHVFYRHLSYFVLVFVILLSFPSIKKCKRLFFKTPCIVYYVLKKWEVEKLSIKKGFIDCGMKG